MKNMAYNNNKIFPSAFYSFKDWYAYHKIFICLENSVETAYCPLDKACVINVILQLYCWFIKCTVVHLINSFDGSTFPLLRENVHLWVAYYSLQTEKIWLPWQLQTVVSLSWPSNSLMENICQEITDWHKVFGRKYLWELHLKRFPQF